MRSRRSRSSTWSLTPPWRRSPTSPTWKSPWTIGHSRGVADLRSPPAQAQGLSPDDAKLVRRAGLVHDLGRLGVSNDLGQARPAQRARARARAPVSLPDRADARRVGGAGPAGRDRVQHHERLTAPAIRAGCPATRSRRRTGSSPRPTRTTRYRAAAASRSAHGRGGRGRAALGVRAALFDSDAAEAVLERGGPSRQAPALIALRSHEPRDRGPGGCSCADCRTRRSRSNS